MTEGMQISADLKQISTVTVTVTCGERAIDFKINLAGLIDEEVDACLKEEVYIREEVLPTFEGRNEEVVKFFEERLMHRVTRKSILIRMRQDLAASANPQ